MFPRFTQYTGRAICSWTHVFRNLGNLIYAETGDIPKSLNKYNASHANYGTSETADTLSQFLYRIGRDKNKRRGARDKQIKSAVKLAKEAVERDNKKSSRDPAESARYQLQLAMALTAAGMKEAEEATEVRVGLLTLEVSPEQAERLTFAVVNGNVWLTLVPTDFVETPTDGITLCTLFPDLGALAEEFPGIESACADN